MAGITDINNMTGPLGFNQESYEKKWGPKQDLIDEARVKAEAQGLKYIGDASTWERIKEGIKQSPDFAANYALGSAAGISELLVGLGLATWKGAQMATTTDPERLEKLSKEPTFTKYKIREAMPTVDMVKNKLSGIPSEQFGEKLGYWTAPPGAAFALPGKIASLAKAIKPEAQIATKIATKKTPTKGVATLDSNLESFSFYKPHFDNLKKLALENSSTWASRKGWGFKVGSISEDIRLAEDVTGILAKNSNLKGKRMLKNNIDLENYRKTKTNLSEKEFTAKITRLIVHRKTHTSIDPNVSANILGDTGVPFFPDDVAQDFLNYTAARRGRMYKQEQFYDYVLNKFSKPVDPAENVFKGQEGIGYKYTKEAGPVTINEGIKKITPYLEKTEEGRIALNNLKNYRALREKPGAVATLKRQENIQTLHKDLEGKLNLNDDLTRWEAKENLREFSNAVARLEGIKTERGDFIKSYMDEYNLNYGTNILTKYGISGKYGTKGFKDSAILNEVKNKEEYFTNIRSHPAKVDLDLVRKYKENQPDLLIKEIMAGRKGEDQLNSINKMFVKEKPPIPGTKQSPYEKNYYDYDHIKPFMFGGENTVDNLTIINRKPHRGAIIPGKATKEGTKMDMKGTFERKIHDDLENMINKANAGDKEGAEALATSAKSKIEEAINRDVPFRFSIDEPHAAYRTGQNDIEIFNQIDFMGKDEATKNFIRSLMRKYNLKIEHTPKVFQDPRWANLKTVDRLEKEIESIYNNLSSMKIFHQYGMPREDIIKSMGYNLREGGIVGISQLTRPI